MKNKKSNSNLPESNGNSPSEDDYNKWEEENAFHSADIPKKKRANKKPNTMNEKDFLNDLPGSDLDGLGSELNDEQEGRGNEDEQNDDYNLGGDSQNDLGEPKGWLE